ncbi:MAG: aminopeptidase P family protein [Bryobacterales bacterium]|nr:aminopeptidase P family protein [Bryobacterales bacterium]
MTEREYARRRAAAREALTARRLDGLLVSSPANLRYLSGFTGSNALLVLLADRAVLFTDRRYTLQASGQTGCTVRTASGSLFDAASKWLRTNRINRLGYDPGQLSHASCLRMRSGAARLVPAAGVVEELRMVKSPGEIELIRRSAGIAARAFAGCLRLIRPGITEVELAAELDYRVRRLGAEGAAFDTIVASGRRTAFPHASPSAKVLASNEIVLIDMGALRAGYCSDMTRTVFLGAPAARFRRHYRAVLEAQLAAADAVKEGVSAGAVDRAARKVLQASGLGPAFVHATGHGLGLEIHEKPRLARGEKTLLRAGMVITIEPGVYLQKFGGIRIEDTVAVTRNGCEILTPTSKELLTI